MASDDERVLLVTPCDPGACTIYFGMQRTALPTAISLALALNRTLVVPPVEWYDGQAQAKMNTFRASPEGRLPRFTRFSDLYDMGRLRSTGLRVIDLADLPSLEYFERAVLSTSADVWERSQTAASDSDDELQPLITHGQIDVGDSLAQLLRGSTACRRGGGGLQGNLSLSCEDAQQSAEAQANASRTIGSVCATLYGRRFGFDAIRCGSIRLNSQHWLQALREWLAPAQSAAVFSVGHHTFTRMAERGSRAMRIFQHGVRPHPALDDEAERFVAALKHAHGGAHFVAVHWRHGDYVGYDRLTPLQLVIEQTRRVLQSLHGCGGGPSIACPVFLMTNCRNASALAIIERELPTLRYVPSEPWFAEEGARLLVEQSIAARASEFIGSSRSSVTHYIDLLRRFEPQLSHRAQGDLSLARPHASPSDPLPRGVAGAKIEL